MKKSILYIAAAAIIAMSCTDRVDEIRPVDVLDADVVFETVDDLEIGMNGVYDTYSANAIVSHSSIFTDDTRIGRDNGGQGITLHNWIVDPGSNAQGIWLNLYQTINRANRVLEAAEGIDPGEERARYDVVRGEALAWRAYAHLMLTSFYAPSFEPDALGVPYIRDVIVLEEPARNTVAEVFAEIKVDLNEAEALLPADGDVTRFNGDILNAVRARLALLERDFATAASLAQALVTKYPLANQTDLVNTFRDLGEEEIIFKLTKTINDGRIGGVWYFTGTGGAFFEMSRGFYESMDANDIRFQINVDQANSDNANDLLLIGKYLGKDGVQYLNDIKVFRSAEMQLILAEARAQTGDLPGAAAAIDALRDLRFGADQPAPSYGSTEQALADIMNERRVELAYEGFRFIDLKRTRIQTTQSLNRDARDCGGGTPCDLDLADQRWGVPVPLAEINANNNMVQNPGY
jgi:hypothetical protein